MKIYKMYDNKLYEYEVTMVDNDIHGNIYFFNNEFCCSNALDTYLSDKVVYSLDKERVIKIYKENHYE